MISRGLESGKSWREVAASYSIGLSAVYDVKKWKDQLQLFVASSKRVKDHSKQQILKEPKLAQLEKVLCKWL